MQQGRQQQQAPSVPRFRQPYASELASSAADYLEREKAVEQFYKETKPPPPEPTTTNPALIAQFLKKHHFAPQCDADGRCIEVQKLQGQSLYAPGSTRAEDHCIVKNRIRVTLEYHGNVPPEGVTLLVRDAVEVKGCSEEERHGTPMSLVTLCCRSYDNSKTPYVLSGALNIADTHKAYLSADKDGADLQDAIGALRNASMTFKANTKEEHDQHGLHIQHVKHPSFGRINYHYGNPDFITMTHPVHPEHNLMNGLVKIPADVCKAAGYELYDEQAALEMHIQGMRELRSKLEKNKEEEEDGDVMDTGEEEISQAEREQSIFLSAPEESKIRNWYAMAYDHILSWAFHTSELQRKSMGIRCKILNAGDKPFCWLVPDAIVRSLAVEYTRTWHDKVDVRDSLDDIGIIIAPPLKAHGTLQNVHIRVHLTLHVIFWKNGADYSKVAPRLLPNFPKFTQFVDDPFSELKFDQLKI